MIDTKTMQFLRSRFYKDSVFDSNFFKSIEDIDRWLLLASRYDFWVENSTHVSDAIPKKIHQIWLGGAIPSKYSMFTDSWLKINPDYDYKLWGEEDILGLLDSRLYQIYSETKNFGAKSDIARYVILEKIGGIYADTDFECLKSLDAIVNSARFFAGITVDTTPQIMNSLIASTPNHPFIKALVLALESPVTSHNGRTILESTGPFFFSDKFFEFFNLTNKDDIVFPTQTFYPFPSQARYEGYKNPAEIKLRFVNEAAFAIHYWEVSWQKKDTRLVAMLKCVVKRLLNWKKLKSFLTKYFKK